MKKTTHSIAIKPPSFWMWLLLTSLSVTYQAVALAAPVENFGENLTGLRQAFANQHVHILQIGDSHTAGDFFTEQLRKNLQAEVGDGGLGFAYPMQIAGQRTARHGYQSTGWRLYNSRFDGGIDYALGGVVAVATSQTSPLTLTSRYYQHDQQHALIVVKGKAGQHISLSDSEGKRQHTLPQTGWQTLTSVVRLPVTVRVDNQVSIAGFWLNRQRGGRVSSIGINGATQDYWQRWHAQLSQDLAVSQANLVILAYGTNEAFAANVSRQATAVKNAIRHIRQGLPQAAILVLGAPESLSQTQGSCGVRATHLDTVQTQLRQLAQQQHTLYWDWQAAMGGRCSMKTWVAKGLAASDGVHFSATGYQTLADDLYKGLKQTLAMPNTNQANANITIQTTTQTTRPLTQQQTAQPQTSKPQGTAKICNAQGCMVFK